MTKSLRIQQHGFVFELQQEQDKNQLFVKSEW